MCLQFSQSLIILGDINLFVYLFYKFINTAISEHCVQKRGQNLSYDDEFQRRSRMAPKTGPGGLLICRCHIHVCGH